MSFATTVDRTQKSQCEREVLRITAHGLELLDKQGVSPAGWRLSHEQWLALNFAQEHTDV